ncbi:MAG: FAD-dependent oxidoreductase [Bdellovibrionaceae bacterium]|nr:FAD-dependent oxidoreductase [Bdellovibrionales bacterium]MCB9085657.1 FAD-dependent oxidoreductase [Pseudobdellovibrionaceae bacterium]
MKKQVVVVGGGISGLTSALSLAEAGYQVDLYESKDHLGGLISTHQGPYGKSESAANGILNSLAVENLFRRLNVPLTGVLPTARARYVLVDGRPQRWPFSFAESMVLFFRLSGYMLRGKSSMAPRPGETVAVWLERTLGKNVNDKFLAPALLGIYASRSSELSASLVMAPFFAKSKKKSKPEIRGTVAPVGGMGALVDALVKSCAELGVHVHLNEQYNWDRWDGGKTPHVFAGAAHQAAEALRQLAPEAAVLLGKVRMLPVVSATLFYPKESSFLTGFGCLFSEEEKMNGLGVLFPGCIFPERTTVHAETWIMGGAVHPEMAQWSPEQVVDGISSDRRRLAGQDVEPLDRQLFRWPKALPYYDLYLEKALDELKLPKGLYLNGNFLGKIGLAGLIERGLELPDQIQAAGV